LILIPKDLGSGDIEVEADDIRPALINEPFHLAISRLANLLHSYEDDLLAGSV
jgi:hypothetical protein